MLVFLRSASAPTSSVGRSLERQAQSDVASIARNLGSPILARTLVPNTLTVRLTGAQAVSLAANPLVVHVLADATIPGPPLPYAQDHSSAGAATSHHVVAHAASCGTAAHPQLNPEALTNINAPAAWAQGATGKGVKVAFLADGLDIANPDLLRNAHFGTPGSPVIVDYQDFSGDGTAAPTGGAEAFGDAASIAAQGNTTYDLSNYVSPSHPLPVGCDIKVVGVAPGASVIALKIFGSRNLTTGSGFVQAINYAVANGAKVINESFGGNPFPDTATDIIRAADDAAVAAGVTVVASSGDAGISSTIGSPATDPKVLGVGASTTFRSYQQDTFGGINAPGENGGYVDNNISSLSSGGFAQDGKTVNLVAPGDLGWSLCSANAAMYSECAGANLQDFGGTSQSSPLTAGAAADVIQAYATTHHGAYPSPGLVKRIITSTTQDIFAPASQQGAGLLDVGAAVALARSIRGTTAARSPGLLSSTSQINLSGAPSSEVTSQLVTLTNTGTHTAHVQLSTRALSTVGGKAGVVTLDPSVSTAQPKFAIWSGALEIYQKATIKVPSGLSRLQLQASYQYTGQTSLLHIALFDPKGNLEGYSLPQGLGDFADVEAAMPMKGQWTAVFFTVWNGYGSGNVGTSGPVPWNATFLKYQPNGFVSPSSLSIHAGDHATFRYHELLPSTPGDSDAAISVRSGNLATTIPVTLRTNIVVGKKGGKFAGVLTGGNGRAGAPGQTNTYDFHVAAGKTDLDASLSMSSNPGAGGVPADQLIGMLVDPNGQLAAYDSNYTLSGGAEVFTPYLNLYKAHPVSGTWQLVLQWAQPTAGVLNAIPFTGAIEFNQVSVSNNLPDSVSSTVSASTGADVSVTVTNNGVAPMLLSPDARLNTSVSIPLSDVFGASLTRAMPNATNAFYIPTETSSFNEQVAGTVPMTFDVSSYPGDPDISPTIAAPFTAGSLTPSLASVTYSPPSGVTSGLWNSVPAEIGPYGSGPEPSASETTSAAATTLGFDPTVTSGIGDTVEALTIGTSTISPAEVPAGSATTISLHIAPTGAVGSVQTGTLFINANTPGSDLGLGTIVFESLFTGDLASIPYEYTVAT